MGFLISLISPHVPTFVISVLILIVACFYLGQFLFGTRNFYLRINRWRQEKAEFKESLRRLKNLDSFYAHIIQVGGNFSMIYSVSVHIYEDGGYYLNPPENFVNIGFNKGGDNMMIFPTNLVRKAKFKIGSAESVNDGNAFVDDEEGGFYNVSINKNRNYYIIKFVKIT